MTLSKYTHRTQIFLMSLLIVGSFVGMAFIGTPTAYAAGCTANPQNPPAADAQQTCIAGYRDACKETQNAGFCRNLSLEDINRCAANGTFKFRAPCLQTLADNYVPPPTEGSNDGLTADDCVGADLNKGNCGIINLVILITNVMSGIAGVVIVAALVAAGIRYSSAGADPSKVQAAKGMIFNALIALLLLIFGYSLLQWLVPGGIF